MEVNTLVEQTLFNTTKISLIYKDGKTGSGTGFFFEHEEKDGIKYPFIVTNKHVLKDSLWGKISFQKRDGLKPLLGEGIELEFNEQDWAYMWLGHPSPDIDIAVCALAPIGTALNERLNFEPFFTTITEKQIPTEAQLKQLSALEDITFIGYPNGIWDRTNLLPVIRKGTTATPLQIDFEGTPKFLIDASVFGGSSGSPVYILNQGGYADKYGNIVGGQRVFFLGVVTAVCVRRGLNDIISVPIPTASVPMAKYEDPIDLGIVFKARTVVETVEEFMKTRLRHLPY